MKDIIRDFSTMVKNHNEKVYKDKENILIKRSREKDRYFLFIRHYLSFY